VSQVAYTSHDDLPGEETKIVDAGLDAANHAVAPLHEVSPMSCFARLATGEVVGGAIGRSWGPCCELQQLWVHPAHRRSGIGSRLVREFEALARSRGCVIAYLETLSFQAPGLYRSLGYETRYEHAVYPYGIVRYMMTRSLA